MVVRKQDKPWWAGQIFYAWQAWLDYLRFSYQSGNLLARS
jgi:hypothetical protein